jgi:hypothetical protein
MTRYRTGRRNHRTIYLQTGPEPDYDNDVQVGTMDTPELGEAVVEALNRPDPSEADRNARAYGWEIGRGQVLGQVVNTTEGNPFMSAEWRDDLRSPFGSEERLRRGRT